MKKKKLVENKLLFRIEMVPKYRLTHKDIKCIKEKIEKSLSESLALHEYVSDYSIKYVYSVEWE